MKIIITGSSGFVGKNLTNYLVANNNEVFNLNLRISDWKWDNNLGAQAIIHLAGKAHDTTNTSTPGDYFRINTDLTVELFNRFLDSDIKDFIYFSSVKAVADTVDGILEEDILGSPVTPYGQSKLKAENYLLSKQLPAGKRLFIIRPCMIHGPGNKGNLNLLYKIVEKRIPWPLASFENQRSFLGIDNLIFLLEAILENLEVPSGIYNFADDKPLSTNELVQIIAKELSIKSTLLYISPSLIKSLVKVGDILPLPLNSERLKKLTESYVVSNSKIKKALGLSKLPISAEDGLVKTVSSFKSQSS